MDKYFFTLGRNSTLSLAEIVSLLRKKQITYKLYGNSDEVAVFETGKEAEISSLFAWLGGSAKYGKICDELSLTDSENRFNSVISAGNLTRKYLKEDIQGKVRFGLSLYNLGAEVKDLILVGKRLDSIRTLIKDNLREKGIHAGYAQERGNDRRLSSVAVAKNRLTDKGAEIVVILEKNKLLIGKTLAVQDFSGFSFRDFRRPGKDKKSGIMPPKLARMMINLAGIAPDGVLLDPFCGSGTVVTEGIVMGYKNIIATDVSARAVSDTKRNAEFMFSTYRPVIRTVLPSSAGRTDKPPVHRIFRREDYHLEMYQCDVKNISLKIKHESVDSVVTEPFLGPPLFRQPDDRMARNIHSGLKDMYLKAFGQFRHIIKNGGSTVIIFPAFRVADRLILFDGLDEIIRMGFDKMPLFPEGLHVSSADLSSRDTIIYGSPGQFVLREIVVLKKVKNP